MADSTTQQQGWWGHVPVATGHSIQWRIGPLRLEIRRLPREWQFRYRWDDGDVNDFENWQQTYDSPDAIEDAKTERYIFQQTTEELQAMPALADRSVVSRPLTPLHLAGGADVTLFISSPLWFRIIAGESPRPCLDIPIQRPSDTWFGASTGEGELCYASRTHGRLELEELPRRPHRAVTPVTIRNQAGSSLLLERINLPVTLLPLFSTEDGFLWTPTVTLERDRDAAMVSMQLDEEPPPQAQRAVRIAPPRQEPEKGRLMGAIDTLFG